MPRGDCNPLALPLRIFAESPDCLRHWQNQFHFLLVDEYQDTNPVQFALLKALAERRRNLCVVGDPDQSIYRFRGADIQNIIDFETHYPDASVVTLDQNYRSTGRILGVANSVIRNNPQRPEKSLRTENEAGEPVGYYNAFSGEDEAKFVVQTISRHLARGRRSGRTSTRGAVLYRTNAQSRLFEEACQGMLLPDALAVMGSLDLVIPDIDR